MGVIQLLAFSYWTAAASPSVEPSAAASSPPADPAPVAPAAPAPGGVDEAHLDPLSLVLGSSGVVAAVLVVLLVASAAVWMVLALKLLQLQRLRSALVAFEQAADGIVDPEALLSLAVQHKDTPGGRIVMAIGRRHQLMSQKEKAPDRSAMADLLSAVGKRAIAEEAQRASSLMATLSSIASASPFIGLFGTVWGIMQAFLRIGVAKSASLPVVAPAIGEALIATAVGLFAAIPATIGYNFVDKRIGNLLEELEASTDAWVQVLVSGDMEY